MPVLKSASVRPQLVHARIRGNRIRARLHALTLTQEQVADLAGLSYRHFNRILLENAVPSLLTALRLQTVLDAPIASLWDLDVKTTTPKRRKKPAD